MAAYFCPMHAEVESTSHGQCPVCGMELVTHDARFPMLQHMLGNRVHLAVMAAVMLAVMAGAMMFLH